MQAKTTINSDLQKILFEIYLSGNTGVNFDVWLQNNIIKAILANFPLIEIAISSNSYVEYNEKKNKFTLLNYSFNGCNKKQRFKP